MRGLELVLAGLEGNLLGRLLRGDRGEQAAGGLRIVQQRAQLIAKAGFFDPQLYNPLPDQIKINLLRLSTFIDQRSLDIMAYPEPQKLNIIININHNGIV